MNFLSFASKAVNAISSVYSAFGDSCAFKLTCGSGSVELPVTPGSFEVSKKYNNSSLDINSLGEINMLGKRGLQTIKFTGMFPNKPYSFANSLDDSPYSYVDKIDRLANSGKPCRIVISGTNISAQCTIDEFTHSEKDGTGDVYYSISLREYRNIQPDADVVNETTGLKSRVAEAEKTKTVTARTKSSMEMAIKAAQKAVTIAEQGQRELKMYKALVKSGGVSVGDALTITTKEVIKNGKLIQSLGG